MHLFPREVKFTLEAKRHLLSGAVPVMVCVKTPVYFKKGKCCHHD